MTFAKGTGVGTDRTKAQIDKLLSQAGASKRGIAADEMNGLAMLSFEISAEALKRGRPAITQADAARDVTRAILLRVPMPKLDAREFQYDGRGHSRTYEKRRAAWEQACRERWRMALLLIKAKLEAIRTGTSTIEREFLADIKLADGRTVHQVLELELDRPGPLMLGSGA